MGGGCASLRPYFATKAEDQQIWREQEEEAGRKPKADPLGGPLGGFLYFLGTVGSFFQ